MKEFIRYVSLSILGQLGISCYILADTFFISKGLGANGLTALNLAIPIYNFIFGCGLMLGVGGATKFSILKGIKHLRETDEIYSNTVILTILLSLVFVMLGLFGARELALLLGADEATLEMTTTYLRWILIFAPVFMMNAVLQCFVRNDEAPNLVMFAMLAGSFANIILDYIFIFPMQMGIFGAVIATGFSPVISMLVMMPHWLKKKNTFHFVKAMIKRKNVMQITSLGFPSLLAQVSGGIVMIIFNMLILRLEGNVGVAAHGVVANISIVVTALYTGLAQGMQPLLSTYYGVDDKGNIRKTMNYGQITMLVISAVIYGILFIFAPQVTDVFNSEGNQVLQKIAEIGLKLYFTSNIFVGFNTVSATFFTSVEKALPAHILSLLRGLVLIIPLAFIMSALWGMNGIWMSFPVAEAVTAIVGFFIYLKIFKTFSA
ncbi:MAG: MATE family efflux transporter [Lachnospiraceae bacterium]|nr:MATE family efflux transporter [Lachnospiraceae bacterium]